MSDLEFGATMVPLPWQQPQWQALTERLQKDQLAHAILLHGEPGNGKEQFALAFAHRLLCSNPMADLACGQCKGCQLNKAGTHPDLQLVQNDGPNKLIKVDQIREVVNFVAKKSQLNGYKVVIVSPADMMNVNASNALLKSLEEPGARTLIFLVCHQVSRMLATIRSRCQLMEFLAPEREMAQDWLAKLLGNGDKVRQLLDISGGAPLKAAQLAESEWLQDRAAIAQQWLAVASGRADPIKTASDWVKYPLPDLLSWLMAWQIDLVKILANSEAAVVNQDLRPAFNSARPFLELNKLFQCYDHLLWLYQVAQSSANPNPQLLLEEMLLKWSQVSGNK